MAEVAIGKTCPTCGTGTITYAGKKSDEFLSASCYVCKNHFTTPNPQYEFPLKNAAAIGVFEVQLKNQDGTKGKIRVEGWGLTPTVTNVPNVIFEPEAVTPDTGETVNPDQPPTSGTGQ